MAVLMNVLAVLCVASLCISTVSAAYPIYQGYGSQAVPFIKKATASGYTFAVESYLPAPAGTGNNALYYLRLNGGKGTDTVDTSVQWDFAGGQVLQPPSISFWARNWGVRDTYFQFGYDAAATVFYVSTSQSVFWESNVNLSPTSKTDWVYIRIDFNWANKTYLPFVNGIFASSLNMGARPFKYPISQLSLMNWWNPDSSGVSMIDEVYIGCPAGCNGQPCDSTTGKCQCPVNLGGADCGDVVKALTADVTISDTLLPLERRFFSFSVPAGQMFSVTIKTPDDGTWWRTYVQAPGKGLAMDTAYTYPSMKSSEYASGGGYNQIYNVDYCYYAKTSIGAGVWTFAVHNSRWQSGGDITVTATLGSGLVNNRPITASSVYNSPLYAITVPSGAVNAKLSYSITGTGYSTSSIYTVYASKIATVCTNGITAVGQYNYKSLTFPTTYTLASPIDVVAGETWFFQTTSNYATSITTTVQISDCTKDCSGRGVCQGNKCYCSGGWVGNVCNELPCTNNCGGIGTCNNGTCSCPSTYIDNACNCEGTTIAVGEVVSKSGLAQNQAHYYSVDLSNNLEGVTITLLSTNLDPSYAPPTIYASVSCPKSNNQNLWTVNNNVISACAIAGYGKKWVIAIFNNFASPLTYSFKVDGQASPIRALDFARFYPNIGSGVADGYTYAFDVPKASAISTIWAKITTTYSSSASKRQLTISQSPCPNGAAVAPLGTMTQTLSGTGSDVVKLTVSNVPKGRFYVFYKDFNTPAAAHSIQIGYENCKNTNDCTYGNGQCVDNACQCNNYKLGGFFGATCVSEYKCNSCGGTQSECIGQNLCRCDTADKVSKGCGCSSSVFLDDVTTTATNIAVNQSTTTNIVVDTTKFPNGFIFTATTTAPYTLRVFTTNGGGYNCPFTGYESQVDGNPASIEIRDCRMKAGEKSIIGIRVVESAGAASVNIKVEPRAAAYAPMEIKMGSIYRRIKFSTEATYFKITGVPIYQATSKVNMMIEIYFNPSDEIGSLAVLANSPCPDVNSNNIHFARPQPGGTPRDQMNVQTTPPTQDTYYMMVRHGNASAGYFDIVPKYTGDCPACYQVYNRNYSCYASSCEFCPDSGAGYPDSRNCVGRPVIWVNPEPTPAPTPAPTPGVTSAPTTKPASSTGVITSSPTTQPASSTGVVTSSPTTKPASSTASSSTPAVTSSPKPSTTGGQQSESESRSESDSESESPSSTTGTPDDESSSDNVPTLSPATATSGSASTTTRAPSSTTGKSTTSSTVSPTNSSTTPRPTTTPIKLVKVTIKLELTGDVDKFDIDGFKAVMAVLLNLTKNDIDVKIVAKSQRAVTSFGVEVSVNAAADSVVANTTAVTQKIEQAKSDKTSPLNQQLTKSGSVINNVAVASEPVAAATTTGAVAGDSTTSAVLLLSAAVTINQIAVGLLVCASALAIMLI